MSGRIFARVLLGALLLAAPARAQSDDEATLSQPLLAIGAFGLGAVDATCLLPTALSVALTLDDERPPPGMLVVGYVCAAVQISAGTAYALRDGPRWQRTVGGVTAGLGALSLGAALFGTFAPAVEVAGARIQAAPWVAGARSGETIWGLTLRAR